jgi:hypothetical protein
LLCLVTGTIDETDEGERRDAAPHVRFDLDPAGLETDEGKRDRACKHPGDGTEKAVTRLRRLCG